MINVPEPAPALSPPPQPPPSGPSVTGSLPKPDFAPRHISREAPGKIALPAFRLRSSLDLRSPANLFGTDAALSTPGAEAMAAAAAIRWAGSRVSLAPLALPSPERELTDPLHGYTAAIPGSHPPETPGGSRLSSFWVGTQEVEDSAFNPIATSSPSPANSPVQLPSIDASVPPLPAAQQPLPLAAAEGTAAEARPSPLGEVNTPTPRSPWPTSEMSLEPGFGTLSTPGTPPAPSSVPLPSQQMPRRSSVPPATAPVLPPAPSGYSGDYFSSGASSGLAQAVATGHSSSSSRMSPPSRRSSQALRPLDEQHVPDTPSTVPALPRRLCLTRQTSAPLPQYLLKEKSSVTAAQQRKGGRKSADGGMPPHRLGRAVREEQMYAELGYLAPPMPPDELERRREVYKFNIWNTSPDPNFDRIVHLAKLVFNTKYVTISLADGNVEWCKAHSGFGLAESPFWMRASSIAAHALLQRHEEPMIVLDTHLDWRFARNPLVVESPNIRFYAGAPLRTQDGFNLGALAVFDDQPRAEFSPRQRHTLKEFAAVAMRELELWRDKIQLRIRDRIQNSMELFTRECLEIDSDSTKEGKPGLASIGVSMERVYTHAARLVKRTLDVEGAIVLDVSHSDVIETTHAEGAVSITMHSADGSTRNVALSHEDAVALNDFFNRHPDGKISEAVAPPCLRMFLSPRIQYALTVPIRNVDKRPFALLCAYNASEHTKRYLEGHELSYLRAIGVIILSAVLKRRMLLADKSKSLFISNISHELRTPLHGILAASELLADSQLTPYQMSFLQTVQACGTSLVETVNHVLDFTKLSGNTKAGGTDTVITRSKVDLMQLVEEAVEGSWLGYQARMSALSESDIGSVYAPPKQAAARGQHVETVIDIGQRRGGWMVKCEKGGIRRVLMNLFGNSLKFTTNGYIHVTLRELPHPPEFPPHLTKLELSVIDSGKGITQDFLKNQLFHPFSQENPLQTGTGLGLAIVNSIVKTSSVDGSIDVTSTEGVGTEIRISFTAEVMPDADSPLSNLEPFSFDDFPTRPTAALIGFDLNHRGFHLLHDILQDYLAAWGIPLNTNGDPDIFILNEDVTLLEDAINRKDPSKPFIILTEHRGGSEFTTVASEYDRIGGFVRLIYKPGGPSRLRAVIKLCLHTLQMGRRSRASSIISNAGSEASSRMTIRPLSQEVVEAVANANGLPRRNSDDSAKALTFKRPSLGPRALSALATAPSWDDERASAMSGEDTPAAMETPRAENREPLANYSMFQVQEESPPLNISPVPALTDESSASSPALTSPMLTPDLEDTRKTEESFGTTVSVGANGTLLQSSMQSHKVKGSGIRVLIVEDNSILRNLLIKWLTSKRYEHAFAVNGRDGVHVFENNGPFDVVLLDMSMPLLDGVGATLEIRAIEASRGKEAPEKAPERVRILALTGMSSREDKDRAFKAGVDGYLVKPVAFKALDDMFHKMGLL